MIAIKNFNNKTYTYQVKIVEPQYIPVLNTAEYQIENGNDIILLHRVKYTKETIPQEFQYCSYIIGDKVYTHIWTRKLPPLNRDYNRQLSLF